MAYKGHRSDFTPAALCTVCTMQFEIKLLQFCLLWLRCTWFVFPFCNDFRLHPPTTVFIPEGGGITIYCEYAQPARVDWYKGSIALTPSTDNSRLCDCTPVSVNTGPVPGKNLIFSNFRESSAGQYGCWASLLKGFDECNFEVVVAVPPVIMLNQSNVIGNQLNDDLTISPTINFGIPEATVTWSQNGEVLDPSDPRVAISSGGALTVTGVQTSDRGVYTVTASNVAEPDGVTASVMVDINFAEVEGPTFRYLDNNGLEVNCVATGYPPPVIVTLSPRHTRSNTNSARNISKVSYNITKEIRFTYPTCNPITYTCMAMSGTEFSMSRSAIPTCGSQPDPTPDGNSNLGAQASLSCGAKLNPASIVILIIGIILIICSPLVAVAAIYVYMYVYKSRRTAGEGDNRTSGRNEGDNRASGKNEEDNRASGRNEEENRGSGKNEGENRASEKKGEDNGNKSEGYNNRQTPEVPVAKQKSVAQNYPCKII